MGVLTLNQIKEANDLKMVRINVPEWGGEICLRSMKAWQRDKFDAQFATEDRIHLRAKLIAASLCDENGAFYDVAEEDIIELSNKNAAILDRLADECCKLSRIGAIGREAQAELEKNSAGQSENSGKN